MSIFSGITSSDEIVQRSAEQEESVQKTGMFILVATSVPGIVLLQGSGQYFFLNVAVHSQLIQIV